MTIGKLSRRNFILSALAATSVASLGVPIFNDDLGSLEKVIQSFPEVELMASENPLRMTFFMHMGKWDNGQLGLKCSNVVVDCMESYDLQAFLGEDFTELSFDEPRHNVSAIVSGANRVAKQTRRGRGNHYAVMSDHILVWYKGQNIYDAPIQRVGNNLAYGPNFKDYFVKVKGFTLTQNDHDLLEYNGFTRIS